MEVSSPFYGVFTNLALFNSMIMQGFCLQISTLTNRITGKILGFISNLAEQYA